MNDVVAEVEESRRGAVVRFESGERLWFCRGAWLERSPLRPGDVEDLDGLKQWLLPRQYPQALAGAVRLLAARARSTGEIRQKLEAYGYMDDTVDMVLYKLEKEGLLDDGAFACEWAAARARHQIGRGRILRELVHKGGRRCSRPGAGAKAAAPLRGRAGRKKGHGEADGRHGPQRI